MVCDGSRKRNLQIRRRGGTGENNDALQRPRVRMKISRLPHRVAIEITDEIRDAYAERDRRLDNDPDAPTLPPEFWSEVTVGKYYRPIEKRSETA